MPSPEYTQSEREAAKALIIALVKAIPDPHSPDVCDCDLVGLGGDCELRPAYMRPVDKIYEVAGKLQMALTRANARISELERDLADGSTALRHATGNEARLLKELEAVKESK